MFNSGMYLMYGYDNEVFLVRHRAYMLYSVTDTAFISETLDPGSNSIAGSRRLRQGARANISRYPGMLGVSSFSICDVSLSTVYSDFMRQKKTGR